MFLYQPPASLLQTLIKKQLKGIKFLRELPGGQFFPECLELFSPKIILLHGVNKSDSIFITTHWIFNLLLWPSAKQNTSRVKIKVKAAKLLWWCSVYLSSGITYNLSVTVYYTVHTIPRLLSFISFCFKKWILRCIYKKQCAWFIPSPRVSTSLEAIMVGRVVLGDGWLSSLPASQILTPGDQGV